MVVRKKVRKSARGRMVRIVLLAALAASLLALLASRFMTKPYLSSPELDEHQAEEVHREPDSSSTVNGKWYGLCKADTVHSVQDFRDTVNNDPLLAAHFAGFDWEKARMGKLEATLASYVSYRKNGEIYITRKKIILPVGDGYITDGKRWVRSFCCNEYVIVPVHDTAGGPVSGASGIMDMAYGPQPPSKSASLIHRILPVPEPASMVLFSGGATCLGVALHLRYRRRGPDAPG